MNPNKDWLNEYSEFIQMETTSIPSSTTAKVFKKIHSLLNPNSFSVFAKILIIHLLTGFLSLSVCNQFGTNPFQTTWSLSDVFMSYGGHHFCMLACGLLFLSISLLAAGLFLTIEEIKSLRKTELLQTLSLSFASLGLFAALGAELILTFAALWMLGALIGGFLATEAIWHFKRTPVHS